VVYVAALLIVAGVALYVAAPLIGARQAGSQPRDTSQDVDLDRAIQQRSLAVQALTELEFDREMNKLSGEDYQTLRAPLEASALRAMAEIEGLRAERRADAGAAREAQRVLPPVKPVERRLRRLIYCSQCGERVRADASFCTECGASLSPMKSLAMQAD